ncbi:hypothetical protein [Bryobacter aggregatus]|uniref:hypothetical protein n=1 Tax=Bryobacter aggregatus TaxID=360054 RepID=UPI0004E11339|nr:hypothetical protein [Bryobacter aggregatus]
MTKSFSIFLAGICAGVSATLAFCPSIRQQALDAVDGATHDAWNKAATQRKAITNSVEAAKATYKATVKSAGLQTAPLETN